MLNDYFVWRPRDDYIEVHENGDCQTHKEDEMRNEYLKNNEWIEYECDERDTGGEAFRRTLSDGTVEFLLDTWEKPLNGETGVGAICKDVMEDGSSEDLELTEYGGWCPVEDVKAMRYVGNPSKHPLHSREGFHVRNLDDQARLVEAWIKAYGSMFGFELKRDKSSCLGQRIDKANRLQAD